MAAQGKAKAQNRSYVGVSETVSADGTATYRVTRLDPTTGRMTAELLGSAAAGCDHLHCSLIHIGELAQVHGFNLQDELLAAHSGETPFPLPLPGISQDVLPR